MFLQGAISWNFHEFLQLPKDHMGISKSLAEFKPDIISMPADIYIGAGMKTQ